MSYLYRLGNSNRALHNTGYSDVPNVRVTGAAGYPPLNTAINNAIACVVIGSAATVDDADSWSVCIGHDADNVGDSSVTVGHAANNASPLSVVIGRQASSSNAVGRNVSIGYLATCVVQESVAVGEGAKAWVGGSVALGYNANAGEGGTGNSVALGGASVARGTRAITLGSGGLVNRTDDSVVLGTNQTPFLHLGIKGTVTQGTSNTTTVVLPAFSGIITMFGTVASATKAKFTVTNTLCAAGSVVLASVLGETAVAGLAPTVSVGAVADGSFDLIVHNADAANATAAAPKIHFMILYPKSQENP
jgi:trimeric autotransporter adhesin